MAGNFLSHLLTDPPPAFVFEVSEAGIAFGRLGREPQIGFRPLDHGVISVSPVRDNVLDADALASHVKALAPSADARKKKRNRAVVILPDCSVRIAVLDFDSFPSDANEQLSLVRFRIKKSLPFDLDSAKVSYHVQPNGGNKRKDVIVAAAPLEIVSRYEAPFRAAGFHPGIVTTSTLAALQLAPREGMVVVVKVTGHIVTISVLDGATLRLMRCIESVDASEIAGHLYPTFAYAEDELGRAPDRIVTCGLPVGSLQGEFGVPVEPLRLKTGVPEQHNAGLMGYLASTDEV